MDILQFSLNRKSCDPANNDSENEKENVIANSDS